MRVFRSVAFQIAAVLGLTAAWKLIFFFWDVIPFNSDEAVVALMARHITMGARPIFFYGQAYMGSLDAFLVAAGFLLFGQQVWVIRLVQAVLYLGTVLTTIFIGKEAFGTYRTGVLAGLLLAVPTVNVTL
jgi:4-amino-4-deoxy-L-arabinose transferase-like glycosyltransferase